MYTAQTLRASASLIACPHWRQKLPKTATNCSRSYIVAENGNKSCQKRRQIVARNGNKWCRKQRLLLPFSATFVAVSGDNLSPFSATFVASVDSSFVACPHWRQTLPKTATNCSRSYSRRKRQQKLPETETNCRQCGQALKACDISFHDTQQRT